MSIVATCVTAGFFWANRRDRYGEGYTDGRDDAFDECCHGGGPPPAGGAPASGGPPPPGAVVAAADPEGDDDDDDDDDDDEEIDPEHATDSNWNPAWGSDPRLPYKP